MSSWGRMALACEQELSGGNKEGSWKTQAVLELRNRNGPWRASSLLTLSSRRAVRFFRAAMRKSAHGNSFLNGMWDQAAELSRLSVFLRNKTRERPGPGGAEKEGKWKGGPGGSEN